MAERVAAPGIALGYDASTGYANATDHAGAGVRILAYLIDSAVLFCFSIAFLVAAFLVLFIGTDQGARQIDERQGWIIIALLLAILPTWFVFSLALTVKRGQTIGQYVMGLGIRGEDGAASEPRRLFVYWLSLHPLIFHPIFAASWLFAVWVLVAKTASGLAIVAALAMAALCFLVPLASLFFMLSDPQRRSIHDRLAGMRVQHLE